MDKERIDGLVMRLGRCVGGKLADDVAKAVQEMHAELEPAQTLAREADARAIAAKQECEAARVARANAEAELATLRAEHEALLGKLEQLTVKAE